MAVTLNQIKQMIRKDLKCPVEFTTHLSKFGDLDKLKSAMNSGDNDTVRDIMETVHENYIKYCHDCRLDPDKDNTELKPRYWG